MNKYVFTVGIALAASLCGACDEHFKRTPCDQREMLRVVNKDIKQHNRNPSEYKLAETKQVQNGVYVGMSANYSPIYRRHYIIDSSTCKIIYAYVDQ